MNDHGYLAERLETIRAFLRARYPYAAIDDGPHNTSHRFVIRDPGRSRILDITDTFLAIHKTHLNIDEIIEREGVLGLLRSATSQQRVICAADGAFIDDDVK